MPTRSIMKFGPFEVDTSLGELRKDGVRIPIQEKPLRVLEALLERRGDSGHPDRIASAPMAG